MALSGTCIFAFPTLEQMLVPPTDASGAMVPNTEFRELVQTAIPDKGAKLVVVRAATFCVAPLPLSGRNDRTSLCSINLAVFEACADLITYRRDIALCITAYRWHIIAQRPQLLFCRCHRAAARAHAQRQQRSLWSSSASRASRIMREVGRRGLPRDTRARSPEHS